MTLKKLMKLEHLQPCEEALDWLEDRDLKTAWAECQRADWMMWLACRLPGIARKEELVQGACICARTVLYLTPEGSEERHAATSAIEAAEAWLKGPSLAAAVAAYTTHSAAAHVVAAHAIASRVTDYGDAADNAAAAVAAAANAARAAAASYLVNNAGANDAHADHAVAYAAIYASYAARIGDMAAVADNIRSIIRVS